MKKRGFKSWVFNRIEAQRKMTTAAAAGMAAVGFVVFLFEAAFLLLVFATTWGLATAILVLIVIFGAMGIYSASLAQKELQDRKHKAKCNNETITLRVFPGNAWVWSWAFGSMDPDRPIMEKVAGLTMLVPRLFCTAWHTWHRVEEVKNIDPNTTLQVMKILFRSDHSVRAQAISDGLNDADLVKAIKDVSLLDGVVFLTKDEVSLSVAPRLHEHLDRWRAGGEQEDSEDNQWERE